MSIHFRIQIHAAVFSPSKSKCLRHYYSLMQPKNKLIFESPAKQHRQAETRRSCLLLSPLLLGQRLRRSLGRYREQLHRVFNSAAASPASPQPPPTKEAARRLISAWGAAEDTHTQSAPTQTRTTDTWPFFKRLFLDLTLVTVRQGQHVPSPASPIFFGINHYPHRPPLGLLEPGNSLGWSR